MPTRLRTLGNDTGSTESLLERRVASPTRAVESLRARDVDGVILGCTELPPHLGASAEAADLIDPGRLLAEAAVG